MSEYIGSVISLISKSDIRYLGTLHEINSESSTVALENVRSFGTEGRRGNPDDEIPPSDSVYEYIVFRGSDVKDLRIEEAPTAKENKPPQVPNDPAILGSGQRPPQPPAAPQDRQQQQNTQSPAPGQPPFPQHSPYPPGGFYPPPPAGWGRGGPGGPNGPGGFPPMPYGAPPGWYPPPGQGFPPGPGPYGYGQFPPQPFDQQPPQQGGKPAPIGPNAGKPQGPPQGQQVDKTVEPKSLSQQPHGPPASAGPASGSPAEKTASKETKKGPEGQADPALSGAPTGPRNGRIMPVIPLQSPNVQKAPLQANAANVPKGASGPAAPASVEDATRAASAAVAAAMAKLSVGGQQASNGSTAMDNLTKKVNEMRSNDATRGTRQVSAGHQAAFRGRGRGGARQEARKVEVPATDFDFASANAKFNKEDLVKEAIAGSPLGETPSAAAEAPGEEEVQIPATTYNKATSFFDNISSEAKERSESDGKRPGGREWRGEEQKKNIETFGQESVDNGYRGGYRGRGRGRGGYRGRGYSNQRGRGNYRGHGNAQQPAAAN